MSKLLCFISMVFVNIWDNIRKFSWSNKPQIEPPNLNSPRQKKNVTLILRQKNVSREETDAM